MDADVQALLNVHWTNVTRYIINFATLTKGSAVRSMQLVLVVAFRKLLLVSLVCLRWP